MGPNRCGRGLLRRIASSPRAPQRDRKTVRRTVKNRCARTVAEEHTGAPVAKVHDPAEDFRPQHQAVLPGGGGQQALGGVQSVHKAGAGGVQIKAYGILRKAQLLWSRQAAAGERKSGVTVATRQMPIRRGRRRPAPVPAGRRPDRGRCGSRRRCSKRRERMPVRVEIHSSLVSTILAKSSLVTTFLGTAEPVLIT